MAGPLAHLTILDLSRVLAGPWCTQLLADLGATVIKVEKPGQRRRHARVGPAVPRRTRAGNDTAEAAYYLACNRGKQSVAIDFTKPEGRDLVRWRSRARPMRSSRTSRWAASRDTGSTTRTLSTVNPRLVYASITGFGQDGPYADRAGYDFIIQGMCGFMSVTGERDDLPGGGPQKAGVAITDLMTGMYTSVAIAGRARALRPYRRRASMIDACLFDSSVRDDGGDEHELPRQRHAAAARGQRAPEHRSLSGVRVRRRAPDPSPSATTASSAKFCDVAGVPEWAADPRFATNADTRAPARDARCR